MELMYILYENVIVEIPPVAHSLNNHLQPRHFSSPEPRARQALRLAASSLYQQTATTIEPAKEEASTEMDYSDLDRRSAKKRVVYFDKSDSVLESDMRMVMRRPRRGASRR